MRITVFGTATSGHHLVTSILNDMLQNAGIDFSIQEESNVSIFVEKGIKSVPAIQINDEAIYCLKSNGSFSSSLREFVNELLKKNNYGNMPVVLIPIDFSNTSINAFSYGHRMSTDIGAITKALHVFKPKYEESKVTSFDKIIEKEKVVLNKFVEKMNVDWGSDILKAALIDQEFEIGFPAEKIIECAQDKNTQLIVMGSTGISNSLKNWFGSVSTEIIYKANCPVLLIPSKAKYKGIKKVLIAYDNLSLDKNCIGQLIDFCQYTNAQLNLLHVGSSLDIDDGIKQSLTHQLQKENVFFHYIDSKDIVGTISQFSIANNMDIIVTRSTKRSILEALLHTSISKKLVAFSTIPILVLR
ncbi:MAG: universal stress protein [Saprospiraceae bacterium]